VGSRTHGRDTFFVNSDKESTQRKRRPTHLALTGPRAMQLCQRARFDAIIHARETKSGVLPDLPYQSHMARQGVRGVSQKQKPKP